jgi:hypothetical protein
MLTPVVPRFFVRGGDVIFVIIVTAAGYGVECVRERRHLWAIVVTTQTLLLRHRYMYIIQFVHPALFLRFDSFPFRLFEKCFSLIAIYPAFVFDADCSPPLLLLLRLPSDYG